MIPSSEVPEALHAAVSALLRIGVRAENAAWALLHGVGDDAKSIESILALKKRTGLEGDEVERLLVWHAARQALPRIPSLAVSHSVGRLLEQELRQLHTVKTSLEADTYNFNRAAKMATLRRFPAGPMEWEVSGVPRSWFLQASFPANLRFLVFVMLRLGGRSPCFFMHVAPAPRNRALSVPKEVLRAYYRAARCLQLQPSVRAIVGHAWFHDPAAMRDHPQLEVLSEPYVNQGGLIVLLGVAPPSSGVLEGNAQRKADYLAGRLRYRYGFAMWPRAAAIRWADAHPELAD